MLFELKTETECELTTFVGRTQKSGRDDVPAVTFRLKLGSVPNGLLDLFSPTIRHTAYMAVEGQEDLPGVEAATPILRSKDLKHWAPETRLEGWNVTIARGRNDDTALQMGSVKLDDFKFDLHEGGTVDVDFRASTADVDEEGAGFLWGRQKRKVFARIVAPELPAPAIDGTVGHPGLAAQRGGSGADGDDDGPDATDLFTAGAGTPGPDDDGDDVPPDGGDEGSEGGPVEHSDPQPGPERGEHGPFGTDGGASGTVAASGETNGAESGTAGDDEAFEAGAARAIREAGVRPKRAPAKPRGRGQASAGAVE